MSHVLQPVQKYYDREAGPFMRGLHVLLDVTWAEAVCGVRGHIHALGKVVLYMHYTLAHHQHNKTPHDTQTASRRACARYDAAPCQAAARAPAYPLVNTPRAAGPLQAHAVGGNERRGLGGGLGAGGRLEAPAR